MLHLVDGRVIEVKVRELPNNTGIVEIHAPGGKVIGLCHETRDKCEILAASVRCAIASGEFNKSFGQGVDLDPKHAGHITNQYKRTRLAAQDAFDKLLA